MSKKIDATQGLVNAISANILMLEAKIDATNAIISNLADAHHLAVQRGIDLGTVDRLLAQRTSLINSLKR